MVLQRAGVGVVSSIGFVSRCLKGRLTEDDTGEATEKEEVVSLTETEQERNMRIVRSVIDEETALEMARNFIRLTKVSIPFFAEHW